MSITKILWAASKPSKPKRRKPRCFICKKRKTSVERSPLLSHRDDQHGHYRYVCRACYLALPVG